MTAPSGRPVAIFREDWLYSWRKSSSNQSSGPIIRRKSLPFRTRSHFWPSRGQVSVPLVLKTQDHQCDAVSGLDPVGASPGRSKVPSSRHPLEYCRRSVMPVTAGGFAMACHPTADHVDTHVCLLPGRNFGCPRLVGPGLIHWQGARDTGLLEGSNEEWYPGCGPVAVNCLPHSNGYTPRSDKMGRVLLKIINFTGPCTPLDID